MSLGRRTLIVFFIVSLAFITIGLELYFFTETVGGAGPGTAWINGIKVTGIWVAGPPFIIHPYSDLGLRLVDSGTVVLVATFFESLVGMKTARALKKKGGYLRFL